MLIFGSLRKFFSQLTVENPWDKRQKNERINFVSR